MDVHFQPHPAGFVRRAPEAGVVRPERHLDPVQHAVGHVGAAALGAMGERPEISGRALIFLGLAEGIAIYGLIVAIMILGRLG